MKINFSKMVYGLQNLKVNHSAETVARVNPILDIIHRYSNSNQVDFSEITMEDLDLTLEAALYFDPEDWEENDPDHPVTVYEKTWELRESLLKIKPKGSDSIDFI